MWTDLPACETPIHQLYFLARPLTLTESACVATVGYLLVHGTLGCPAGMGEMCAQRVVWDHTRWHPRKSNHIFGSVGAEKASLHGEIPLAASQTDTLRFQHRGKEDRGGLRRCLSSAGGS